MARLWEAMQRQSEAGRFDQNGAITPNSICSGLAIDLMRSIFKASRLPLFLANMLIGVVGNAIYVQYDPDASCLDLCQYADAVGSTANKTASVPALDIQSSGPRKTSTVEYRAIKAVRCRHEYWMRLFAANCAIAVGHCFNTRLVAI